MEEEPSSSVKAGPDKKLLVENMGKKSGDHRVSNVLNKIMESYYEGLIPGESCFFSR